MIKENIMAYTPHVWIPRLGSNLNRFTKANETATSVDLTNAPENVRQAGTPFSTDIMNEMEEGITDANAGIGLLATCDTAAATQIKEIDMSDYTIKVGMHIDVDFTNGNTVGSVEDGGIASGADIVTKGAGEQIRIIGYNGMFLFNEKIGGEYAGSGCHNAGDCHEFVITTMATGNTSDTAGVIKNKDADYIYNVVGENYSYRKQRNGSTEQKTVIYFPNSVGSSTDWNYNNVSLPIKNTNEQNCNITAINYEESYMTYWGITAEIVYKHFHTVYYRIRKANAETFSGRAVFSICAF